MSNISENNWEFLFPLRDKIYSYKNFLKAVAKFPHFCGEETNIGDLDISCRRELATILAHWGHETNLQNPLDSKENIEEWRQGLYYVKEINCNPING